MSQEFNGNDKRDKNDWRAVMLAQYNIFGVMTGLEVTALTIFSKLSDNLTDEERLVFSGAILFLVLQVVILVLLINAEREVAYGAQRKYISKKGNEICWRWTLIIISILAWILISALLLLNIWR